jgi:hypothetical protein
MATLKKAAKKLFTTFKKRCKKIMAKLQKYWRILLLYDNIEVCNILKNIAKYFRQRPKMCLDRNVFELTGDQQSWSLKVNVWSLKYYSD